MAEKLFSAPQTAARGHGCAMGNLRFHEATKESPRHPMTDILREGIQQALGAQFELGRELGGGGMSRVFLARDAHLGRDVVVKVLSPELAQEHSVERFG